MSSVTHTASVLRTHRRSLHDYELLVWFWIYRVSYDLLIAGVSITALTLIIQLAYPASMSRPFTYIAEQKMGLMSADTIAKQAAAKEYSLRLYAPGSSVVVNHADILLKVDHQATSRELTSYPLKQKLIPFSFFMTRRLDNAVFAHKDSEAATAQKVITKLATPKRDASLAIADGSVELITARSGVSIDEPQALRAVRANAASSRVEWNVQGTVLKPAVETKDQETEYKRLLALLEKRVTLQLTGSTKTVERSDMVSWLDIAQPTGKPATGSINPAKVRSFVENLRPLTDVTTGTPTISTVKGHITVNRGDSPKAMHAKVTAQRMITALQSNESNPLVVADLANVEPADWYENKYEQTSAGLQSLLQQAVNSKIGTYHVAIKELGGDNRAAGINDHVPISPASTYKIFVSEALFMEMQAGVYNWDTRLVTGQKVGACFDLMIVRSDNGCAHTFGDLMGWANIDNKLRAAGYKETILDGDPNVGMLSSAADQVLFMERLHNGAFGDKVMRDRLIDNMKKQIYRYAIPNGARTSVVADKLGYIPGFNNDSGIVYGSNATYAISILTDGGSFWQMADVVRQVEKYFGNQ